MVKTPIWPDITEEVPNFAAELLDYLAEAPNRVGEWTRRSAEVEEESASEEDLARALRQGEEGRQTGKTVIKTERQRTDFHFANSASAMRIHGLIVPIITSLPFATSHGTSHARPEALTRPAHLRFFRAFPFFAFHHSLRTF